jgi:hypothetical protein
LQAGFRRTLREPALLRDYLRLRHAVFWRFPVPAKIFQLRPRQIDDAFSTRIKFSFFGP